MTHHFRLFFNPSFFPFMVQRGGNFSSIYCEVGAVFWGRKERSVHRSHDEQLCREIQACATPWSYLLSTNEIENKNV